MCDKAEWVLERIGPIRHEVSIDKDYLTCGRMKDQDIVCLSLLVSRQHCEFTQLQDVLSVLDFGSSNGVFVNGQQIRARHRFMLKENDYVGIGCSNIQSLDDTMFVYRVKKRVISNDRSARKQQSKTRQDPIPVPNKVIKMSRVEDDDYVEIIDPVIEDNNIEPMVNKPAQECQNIINSSRQIHSIARLKAKARECSITSNNDNEVEDWSGNSAKITKTSKSSHIIETGNSKSNVLVKGPEVIDIDGIESDPVNIKTELMQLDDVGTCDVNITELKQENPQDNAQDKYCSSFIDDNVEIGVTNPSIVKQELIEPSIGDYNEEFIIKEENESGCYSQIDLVEIVDEEDDFFPSSQLFNKSGIKQEIEENADNEQIHTSGFHDDEDDNVITIIDSDEESNDGTNYLDSLLQNTKCEPVFEDKVPEIIVPNILDTDNMEIGNVDPPANEAMKNSTTTESNTDSNVETNEPEVDTNKKYPNNEEIDSSAKVGSVKSFDEVMLALSSLDEPSASSASNNVVSSSSSSVKPRRKGVEIIEPHHMQPKKKKKKSDEDKKCSSKSLTKNNKSKKDKTYKSSSSSSKKSGHRRSSKDSKDIDEKSKLQKISTENKEKKDSDQTPNNSIDQSVSMLEKPREPEKIKNGTTVVKAKISTKSRGDMLCESMQNLRPTPRTSIKKPGSEAAKTLPPKAPEKNVTVGNSSCSTIVIPRRQVPSGSIKPATSSTNNPPVDVHSSNEPAKDVIESLSGLNAVSTSSTSPQENTSTVLKNTTNFMKSQSSSSSSNNNGALSLDTESNGNDVNLETNSLALKPSLTTLMNNGNNKRVSFKENIASVKEFPIDPGNSMRNIKDGPKTVKELPKPLELKIEDFLARVFAWEPCWLEQQQKVKELPPIVNKNKLLPLPNTFDSFEQYYKRMEVLLLLETWQLLLKEYECTGSKYASSQVVCCAIERDSIKQQQTPNRLRYSKLDIRTIVTRDQLKLKSIPVYGDMIVLEYTIKVNGQVRWRRAFAYVIEVRQQNSLRSLPSNHPLFKRINNPHAIITYTVQTRVIDEHTVQFEQLARLRSILYLRPHLRSVKGLQCVPRSALRDSILHVDIDEYNIDPTEKIDVKQYQLITKDKLNEKQTEAVIKFTDAATNMKSKIGLLIGPPGTGKSKVITNLVVQMLYGNGRFTNGSAKRILVCAPSNAAIDEIVLRLLEIRAAITREHRFKMVRIGREECMHEEVKKISVSDLARKEANRQFAGNKQRHLEEREYRKQQLLQTIKSLGELIACDPDRRKVYEMELEHKKSKYEKMTNSTPEADQMERNKLESAAKSMILQKAHVIACTLSSCYNGQMESIFGGPIEHIATCIVDEATQCCEADTLIPLMLGVKNLILVGDPNQLPATVMSTEAKKLGLDRSLFTRAKEALENQLDNNINKSKDPVIMLKEQYRMVQAISHWPNKYFYKGKLIDRVAYKQSFPYQPYRILNVDGDQDQIKFSNTSEAVFVGNLVTALMTCEKIHAIKSKITIGIITPYQNQRTVILSKISEQTNFIPSEIKNKFVTECNTIDSFQGQERDVIIMSCVRSHGIGFLSDPQRLCVALTRAKHTLIICGNIAPFQKDRMWDDLLCDARSRGLIVNLNKNAKPNDIKPHVVRLDC